MGLVDGSDEFFQILARWQSDLLSKSVSSGHDTGNGDAQNVRNLVRTMV